MSSLLLIPDAHPLAPSLPLSFFQADSVSVSLSVFRFLFTWIDSPPTITHSQTTRRGGREKENAALSFQENKVSSCAREEKKKGLNGETQDPCFPRRNDTTVALRSTALARHVNNNTQWRCIYTTAYPRHGRARPCVIGRDAYDSLDKYAAAAAVAAVYPPCRHRFGSPLAFSKRRRCNATTTGCTAARVAARLAVE